MQKFKILLTEHCSLDMYLMIISKATNSNKQYTDTYQRPQHPDLDSIYLQAADRRQPHEPGVEH